MSNNRRGSRGSFRQLMLSAIARRHEESIPIKKTRAEKKAEKEKKEKAAKASI